MCPRNKMFCVVASPTLRRSIGGSIIADDNDKENRDVEPPLTKTSRRDDDDKTPVKATPTSSDQDEKTPSLTLAEMTMAMGIDPDSPGMLDMFSPANKATKAPPQAVNRKRSTRRTTMLGECGNYWAALAKYAKRRLDAFSGRPG